MERAGSVYECLYDLVEGNLGDGRKFSLGRRSFSLVAGMGCGRLDVVQLAALSDAEFILAAYWGIFHCLPGAGEAVHYTEILMKEGRGTLLAEMAASGKHGKQSSVILENNVYE